MDLLKNKSKFKFKSQRQRVSPFPNYMSMESVCLEMKDYIGISLKDIFLVFQDRIMTFYLNKESYLEAGKFIVDQIYKNPELYTNLIKIQKKAGCELADFTKKANKEVKNKISNNKLYRFYEKYEKLYKKVYAPYASVWIIEDVFNADLLKIIEKREKNNTKAIEYLNNLTKEPKAMVARQERQALLEIASEIYPRKRWVKLIDSGNIEKIKSENDLNKKIKNHERKYFWVTRDYEDSEITYEDIIKKLKAVLVKNPKNDYRKIVDELEAIKKSRKEISLKLKLTKKENNLFKTLRDINYYKELRKKYVSESLFYFDNILKEIAKRSYLSLKQVRCLKTSDVYKILIDKANLSNEVNKRIKLSVWYTQNGKSTQIITGEKAQKIWNKYCGFDKNTKVFNGMSVSPGKVRGPIKIVMNPNKIDKVKRGDVILSVQVVPSFASAILRASALVCDGGHGITTHPAILAREAGIPCVIQTQFARKVLKDGDIVEVDGYKGIVKKL